MSISAMKQALEALGFAAGLISPITKGCQCQICLAHDVLRRAIEQAEKQEPVAFVSKCNDGECLISLINPAAVFYTTPVHAINISQERVDETAKRKHEWVEITKGECDELFRASSDHVEYAWAIEAKLKEKNT